MPRSGINGTYTLPGPQATQAPLTPIPSAVNNAGWSDVEQTFNTPTPIAYGGTNATTVAAAQQNLDLEPGVDIPSNAQLSGVRMDARRNRVVNNDMRSSLQNGTTAGTGNGFFPVDQWAQFRVTSAGVLTVQQVASVTPAGSPNRLRATVTTADASLAAGEFWNLSQNLEGSNVADFRYGAAGAFQSVLRFGFRGPAGTYAARLGNSASNRSFVAMFTITAPQANTDTVQVVVIPGDTSGTWLTDKGVIGITLDIVLAAGPTFQGVAGWQSGMILATSAISNGMGTAAAVFELFDVGLRLDPNATGVYGEYEAGEIHPVWRSERYWEPRYYSAGGFDVISGVLNGVNNYSTVSWLVEKAKIPSVSLVSGAWAGATPPINATVMGAIFGSPGVSFYANGTSGNQSVAANSRL